MVALPDFSPARALCPSRQVLSRFNSLVLARVNDHRDVEELGAEATVPVINALSDLHHPLQTLADLMTIQVCASSLACGSPRPPPERFYMLFDSGTSILDASKGEEV